MPASLPEPRSASATLPLPLAALTGAGVGLVTSFFLNDREAPPATLLAALPLIWTAALGAVFLPTARQRWGAAAFSLLAGLLGLLQVNFSLPDGGAQENNFAGWCLLAVLSISGLMLLSGWEGGRRFNVRAVPPFAVQSTLFFGLAAALGGLFYGLIALACVLLQAIGIGLPAKLLLNNLHLALPLLLGAAAFFVTVLRAQPWGLGLTRTLANVLGFLLPVAAVVALLFAAALPLAALQSTDRLYQGILSSPLYLMLTLAFVALTLAAFSVRPVALPPAAQKLSRLAAWLLPLYPALALYGIGVRVGQYGLTEGRLLGLMMAAWLLLVALALACTRRTPAFAGLSRATALCLAGLVALTLSFSLPGLRPFEWAARSQAARLTQPDLTARQSAEIIAQLAYDSGNLGQRLLNRIPDPALSEKARNQRASSQTMTARAFRARYVYGYNPQDTPEFTLTGNSLPLREAQKAALRRVLEQPGHPYLPQPYRVYVLPLPEGMRVMVRGGGWSEGVWADFDKADKLVRSGTFMALKNPQQERNLDDDPFGQTARAGSVTLPTVKTDTATFILQEDASH